MEAGANDGYQQSNTYYLERFCGWHGVLIEPIPELCREAAIERPASLVVNSALVSPEQAGDTVRMRYGGLMSIVAGSKGSESSDLDYLGRGFALRPEKSSYELDVPARTLSAVLDEANVDRIDLLSLDVEGFEPQVLAGLDFDRHAPSFMAIEMHEGEAGLSKFGPELHDRYVLIDRLSEIDMLLRRRDLSDVR